VSRATRLARCICRSIYLYLVEASLSSRDGSRQERRSASASTRLSSRSSCHSKYSHSEYYTREATVSIAI
jgi:hypothetical protein